MPSNLLHIGSDFGCLVILRKQALARAEGKGDWNGKQKTEETKQMSPTAHQLKGLVVVNGKTIAKGNSNVKGQTKG